MKNSNKRNQWTKHIVFLHSITRITTKNEKINTKMLCLKLLMFLSEAGDRYALAEMLGWEARLGPFFYARPIEVFCLSISANRFIHF